jgi:hypothetical protein
MLTIDKFNTKTPVAFTGISAETVKASKDMLKELRVAAKNAKKSLNGNEEHDKKLLNDVAELAGKVAEKAEKEAADKLNNSKFAQKVDKTVGGIFGWVVEKFGKSKSLIGKNKSSEDLAKSVTTVVLLGNTFKELVGTALYTTQAMTNEDLPKDKRKFVGLYDLSVGVVSTIISLVLGVGMQESIRKSYVKVLEPLKHLPKTATIASAAAAFTSFALQTIVGKRIIAPAIATPVAGRLKTKMMEKDEAKKAAENQTVAENTNK